MSSRLTVIKLKLPIPESFLTSFGVNPMTIKNIAHCLFLVGMMIISVSITQSQERVDDTIVELGWSYDSRYLAIGYRSSNIDIYDTETNSVSTHIIPIHRGAILDLAWSPDGQYLASSSMSSDVNIWNPLTGQLIVRIPDLPSDIAGPLCWSPDSRLLMIQHVSPTGKQFNLNVWDVVSNQFVFRGVALTGLDIAWSSNNRRIAIALTNESVLFLDAQTFEQIGYAGLDPYDFITPSSATTVLAWHPDNDQIAYGTALGNVVLWDIVTDTAIVTVQGNESNFNDTDIWIKALWFGPDGMTFNSISGDGTYRTWDTVAGQMLATSKMLNPPIIDAELSPDGTTLAIVDRFGAIVTNKLPAASSGRDQTVSYSDRGDSELVALDGSASIDTDGMIVSYSWTENSTEIATGVTPHVDLAVGVHTITLTVIDDAGASDVDDVVITVEASAAPTPTETPNR